MKKPTHVYVGRKPCGCAVMVTYDLGDKETAKEVSNAIKKGLTIDRYSRDVYRNTVSNEPGFMDCRHVSDGMMLLTMIENADDWIRSGEQVALDAAGGK